MMNKIGVSPSNIKDKTINVMLTEHEKSEWHNEKSAADETLRKRFKRGSLELGSEEYISYFQHREFNQREAWRPYLWQRKRDKNEFGVPSVPTEGWKGWKFRQKARWSLLKEKWNDMIRYLELWRSSLKQIEGRQGTSVVSYFYFLRWILFLNIFIFVLMFVFVVLFQVASQPAEFDKEVTGVDDSANFAGVMLSNNCSASYSPYVSSDGFQLFLDFFMGTGWMETTSFFYGYYTNTRVNIPTGKYNMPFAYFTTTCFIFFFSFIAMIRYMITKYLDSIMAAQDRKRNAKYCYGVFSTWDYGVNDSSSISLQQKSINDMLLGYIEEYRHQQKIASMPDSKKYRLYALRIMMNILTVGIIFACGTAIYFAQQFSTEFSSSDSTSSYDPIVMLFVEYLPSIIIAIFNSLTPIILNLMMKYEQYMPSTVIKLTVARMVLLRFASLAILLIKVYIDATCTPQNYCRVGTGSCAGVQCVETYVGQQIYKLVVTGIGIEVCATLLYELPRKLFTTKCDAKLCKKIGLAEFDVSTRVLDLVYAQTLSWLGFYFAPLLSAVCVGRFIILFYLRKLSAMYCTVPPERPYQASRFNVFFMMTLLLAFVLVAIPVGYVMVNLAPSTMCGPFRIYDYPSDIIVIRLQQADYWFQVLWRIVTSWAFVALVIIIMGLALYYCDSLKRRHVKLIGSLKLQMLQDDKYKQNLISKFGDTSQFAAFKSEHFPKQVKKTEIMEISEVNGGQRIPEKQDLQKEGTGW